MGSKVAFQLSGECPGGGVALHRSGFSNSSGVALWRVPLKLSTEHPVLWRLTRTLLAPHAPADDGDGFPRYVEAAARAHLDVNDWIELNLKWVPALPVLEELVFPYLAPNSIVCEVGVGTGRWSRHIAARIPHGRLALVDKSPWIVSFLQHYFTAERNVDVALCDGVRLPFSESGWADVVFSQGMFITLKLGHVFRYLKEFSHALKPGGVVIVDFIDPETERGWDFLEGESERAHDVFAFHSLAAISKACNRAGLSILGAKVVGKSTYLAAQKPAS